MEHPTEPDHRGDGGQGSAETGDPGTSKAGDDLVHAAMGAPEPGSDSTSDLPEAASRRLRASAWTSALSVPDFAAGEALGMEPVGFVQGYAVMQWGWYSSSMYRNMAGPPAPGGRSQYSETWRCPHGFVGTEHRMYGYNYEQTWVENNWVTGFQLAFTRMVEEAASLGAHGVVGVADTMGQLAGTGAVEFKIQGTAVVVPGAKPPSPPFTTFLAGQRLVKLVEAGFAPVSVVAAMSSVQMIGNCITHYQLAGSTVGTGVGSVSGVTSISQVGTAQRATRHLARQHIRRQLGRDTLHGASVELSEREIGDGDLALECLIRGTRVRRFKDFDPLPEPSPVVRLR